MFEAGHFLLYLFHLGPIFSHHGFEERHQIGCALVGFSKVFLHRPNR